MQLIFYIVHSTSFSNDQYRNLHIAAIGSGLCLWICRLCHLDDAPIKWDGLNRPKSIQLLATYWSSYEMSMSCRLLLHHFRKLFLSLAWKCKIELRFHSLADGRLNQNPILPLYNIRLWPSQMSLSSSWNGKLTLLWAFNLLEPPDFDGLSKSSTWVVRL